MIPGCIQSQSLNISAFSLQQKNEDTEVLIANEMKAVAHPMPEECCLGRRHDSPEAPSRVWGRGFHRESAPRAVELRFLELPHGSL